MLEGAKIRLRPAIDEDLDLLTRIRNDIGLQGQLLARPRGSSRAQVAEWVAGRSRSPDSLFLVIADRAEDRALGFIQYTGLSAIDRHAELGICLAAQGQGQGFGGDAISVSEAWLARQWSIRKVHLKVRADNHPAIACYQKAGFEPCGLSRAHMFLDGDWRDILAMEKFLEDAA